MNDTTLRGIFNKNVTSMKISEDGNWLIFITANGEEMRFCCYGVVSTPVAEYFAHCVPEAVEYRSFKITQD